MITAVCKAFNPPPQSSTIAIPPCKKAQNTLCKAGVCSFPPDVILSTTKDPEYEEVIKKKATKQTAIVDKIAVSGIFCRKTNRAVEILSFTAVIMDTSPCKII